MKSKGTLSFLNKNEKLLTVGKPSRKRKKEPFFSFGGRKKKRKKDTYSFY